MAVDIRRPSDAEIGPWVRAVRRGFLQGSTDADVDARRPDIDLDRTIGAFDAGRVVGTLRSVPTDLVVPGGGRLAASALTNVTVSPTHRRQGLLTSMITRDLQESTDRDEVLSVLVAAEYPIYGRFGYGPAVASVELAVEASAQFRRPPDSGWVELVEPATVRAQLPVLYEAARRAWPGAIDRDARWWDRDLGLTPFPGRSDKLPRFVAVSHDPDGRPDGFVTYTTEERWERTRPLGTLHIEDLIGVSDHAYARLWRYCLEIDWIHQVRAGDRSSDELLPWLLVDARQAFEESRGDFQWVRLLDPAAALSGRTYLCEGTVTIEIVDPMGLASGRFALDGSPGGAQCRRSTSDPDLVMAVDVLGAIYLGGVGLASMARGGGVDECRPGAIARADAMFRGAVAPWCATSF
jgi:predicted acetyltransferase